MSRKEGLLFSWLGADENSARGTAADRVGDEEPPRPWYSTVDGPLKRGVRYPAREGSRAIEGSRTTPRIYCIRDFHP